MFIVYFLLLLAVLSLMHKKMFQERNIARCNCNIRCIKRILPALLFMDDNYGHRFASLIAAVILRNCISLTKSNEQKLRLIMQLVKEIQK